VDFPRTHWPLQTLRQGVRDGAAPFFDNAVQRARHALPNVELGEPPEEHGHENNDADNLEEDRYRERVPDEP
jgi:hypothetical protein